MSWEIVSVGIALAAFGLSFWVATRDGRWRSSEDAKALLGRVSKVEGRVDAHEIQLRDVPTKADLAKVEGEIGAVGGKVDQANRGITRLEGYFLERGVERTG